MPPVKRWTKKAKREAIEAAVDRYAKLLGLENWGIEVNYLSLEHTADCEARPEYKQAIIQIDLDKVTRDGVAPIVAHELLHCVTWSICHLADVLAGDDPKMQEIVRIEEEALTTSLEDLLMHIEANYVRIDEGAVCARCSHPLPRQEGVEPNAEGGSSVQA